jgi:hypothetical protein
MGTRPTTRWQFGHECTVSLHESETRGIQKQGNATKQTPMVISHVMVPHSLVTAVATSALQNGHVIRVLILPYI